MRLALLDKIDRSTRQVEVLVLPDEAVLHHAQIRTVLKARGRMIDASDLLIGARVRSLKLMLVGSDNGEFDRVQDLSIEKLFE